MNNSQEAHCGWPSEHLAKHKNNTKNVNFVRTLTVEFSQLQSALVITCHHIGNKSLSKQMMKSERVKNVTQQLTSEQAGEYPSTQFNIYGRTWHRILQYLPTCNIFTLSKQNGRLTYNHKQFSQTVIKILAHQHCQQKHNDCYQDISYTM